MGKDALSELTLSMLLGCYTFTFYIPYNVGTTTLYVGLYVIGKAKLRFSIRSLFVLRFDYNLDSANDFKDAVELVMWMVTNHLDVLKAAVRPINGLEEGGFLLL